MADFLDFDLHTDSESFSDDIIDDICNALEDDSFGSDFDWSSRFPDCSINQSCSDDLCRDNSFVKPTGDNNNEWSTCSNAQNAYVEKNSLSISQKITKKQTESSNKPRRKRQNITRRPGETDAQLKERRYQAKLKRNRESGMRARKRRQDEVGLLKVEQEQLLEQVHAKRLILRKLEQENAYLQQQLISERAANHPLFRKSGSRMKGRRSQESQAPPLTIFAVAFVSLLTWSATLESSSLYDAHIPSSNVHPRVKVFQTGVPASLVNPAAAMALQPLLEYTLQLQQHYSHLFIKFVQLMALFLISVCFLGLYPSVTASITGSRAKSRVRSCQMHSTRSTSVSFTSSPTGTKRVQHTSQRHVITYII